MIKLWCSPPSASLQCAALQDEKHEIEHVKQPSLQIQLATKRLTTYNEENIEQRLECNINSEKGDREGVTHRQEGEGTKKKERNYEKERE